MDGFGGASSGTDIEEIEGLGINRGGEEGFIEFVIFVDELEIEFDELGKLSFVDFMFLGEYFLLGDDLLREELLQTFYRTLYRLDSCYKRFYLHFYAGLIVYAHFFQCLL